MPRDAPPAAPSGAGPVGSAGPPRLVLASASPRRRELLAAAGLAFDVAAPDIDEDLPRSPDPAAHAVALAREKAAAAAGRASPPAVVIGADTVVVLPDGRLLGKPADEAEGRAHLRALSGTTHVVITGVCLRRVPDGAEDAFHAASRVTMRALGEEEIAAYAASGEGRDKAGGYAIQAGADRFVVAVEGSWSNVVGLPVEETLARLRALGIAP